MIVVANTYIPAFKKRRTRPRKNQLTLATTDAGDVAYYMPFSALGGKSFDSDDDDDYDYSDEDETDDFDERNGRIATSMSGREWKPFFNDRLTVFIAGAPGAGKSHLAKELINLLPSNLDILLFTALEEKDGNFDDLGKDRLWKIKMEPDVLSKIKLAEIRSRTQNSDKKQTILLFDDVDKIRDPKVQQLTFQIMNDALANGRGHEKHNGDGDIHVVCTSHSANDYQKTKYTFENSNYIALFPGATPAVQLYRMFDKIGIDKKLAAKMMKLGRKIDHFKVIVHKVVPLYMIFGNKIMLL